MTSFILKFSNKPDFENENVLVLAQTLSSQAPGDSILFLVGEAVQVLFV